MHWEADSTEIDMYLDCIHKILSEYEKEIPQSQTEDKPMAPRGRATQQSRETRKTNQAKQRFLFLIKMIAKLKWT